LNYNRFRYYVLALSLIIGSTSAQTGDNFIKLKEGDFPGSKITREQVFDGSGLWGYINGGADIFLEYGFDKLLLQEIEIDKYKFKTELYRMSNAKSAFGIFSVSHYKCSERDSSLKYSCITPHQIQTAMGNYYISIINKNGSEEEQSISKMIWGKLISKISEDEFTPPSFFSNKELIPFLKTMKYFNGKLGLQNGFFDWYDYFENFSDYEIYLLPLETKAGTVYISQISFSSVKDLNSFLNNLSITIQPENLYSKKEEKSASHIVKIISPKEMIFIQSALNMCDLEEIVKKLF